MSSGRAGPDVRTKTPASPATSGAASPAKKGGLFSSFSLGRGNSTDNDSDGGSSISRNTGVQDGPLFEAAFEGTPDPPLASGRVMIEVQGGEFWIEYHDIKVNNIPSEHLTNTYLVLCKKRSPRRITSMSQCVILPWPTTDSGALPVQLSKGLAATRMPLSDILVHKDGAPADDKGSSVDPRKYQSIAVVRPGVGKEGDGDEVQTLVFAFANLSSPGETDQAAALADKLRRQSIAMADFGRAATAPVSLAGRTYEDMDTVGRDAFAALGKTKGDGELTFAEFKMVLATLNVGFTEPRAYAWFDLCDDDGSGSIQFEEFQHLLYLVSRASEPGWLTLRDVYFFFANKRQMKGVEDRKDDEDEEGEEKKEVDDESKRGPSNKLAAAQAAAAAAAAKQREQDEDDADSTPHVLRPDLPVIDSVTLHAILNSFPEIAGQASGGLLAMMRNKDKADAPGLSQKKVDRMFAGAQARSGKKLLPYAEVLQIWLDNTDPRLELGKRGISAGKLFASGKVASVDKGSLRTYLGKLVEQEDAMYLADLTKAYKEAADARRSVAQAKEAARRAADDAAAAAGHYRDDKDVKRKKALADREERMRKKREEDAMRHREEMEATLRAQMEAAVQARKVAEEELSSQAQDDMKAIDADRRARLGLDRVDLSRRGLTYLPSLMWSTPEARGRLSDLIILDLSGNMIRQLPKRTIFTLCTSLQKLDLSGNVLESLPDDLGDMGELRILHLHLNQLRELPNTIGKLQKLRKVTLHGNMLRSVPEEITDCASLEVLQLQANQMVELPLSLGKLDKLRELNVSGNRLGFLPDSIGACSGLEKLDARNNSIKELPPTIGKLKRLTAMALSHNLMRELPPEVGSCKRLLLLDVCRNRLRTLPNSISKLSHLLALLVTDNEIRKMDDGVLDGLPRLQTLDLSRNRLTALPQTIGRLIELQALNLSSNTLGTLPAEIGSCRMLRHLDLHSNCLGMHYPAGEPALPPSVSTLISLEWLDLSRNGARGIHPAITACPRLYHLNLSNNELDKLEGQVAAMPCLLTLDLSCNRLTEVAPDIGKCTKLRALDLSCNRLPRIPESIGDCVSLRHLHLYNNRLDVLPPSIAWLLPQLLSFDVGKNPLAGLPQKWSTAEVPGARDVLGLRFARERREPLVVELRRARARDLFRRLHGLRAAHEDSTDRERMSMLLEDTRLRRKGPAAVVKELSAFASRSGWSRQGKGSEKDRLDEWLGFVRGEVAVLEREEKERVAAERAAARALEDADFDSFARNFNEAQVVIDTGLDSRGEDRGGLAAAGPVEELVSDDPRARDLLQHGKDDDASLPPDSRGTGAPVWSRGGTALDSSRSALKGAPGSRGHPMARSVSFTDGRPGTGTSDMRPGTADSAAYDSGLDSGVESKESGGEGRDSGDERPSTAGTDASGTFNWRPAGSKKKRKAPGRSHSPLARPSTREMLRRAEEQAQFGEAPEWMQALQRKRDREAGKEVSDKGKGPEDLTAGQMDIYATVVLAAGGPVVPEDAIFLPVHDDDDGQSVSGSEASIVLGDMVDGEQQEGTGNIASVLQLNASQASLAASGVTVSHLSVMQGRSPGKGDISGMVMGPQASLQSEGLPDGSILHGLGGSGTVGEGSMVDGEDMGSSAAKARKGKARHRHLFDQREAAKAKAAEAAAAAKAATEAAKARKAAIKAARLAGSKVDENGNVLGEAGSAMGGTGSVDGGSSIGSLGEPSQVTFHHSVVDNERNAMGPGVHQQASAMSGRGPSPVRGQSSTGTGALDTSSTASLRSPGSFSTAFSAAVTAVPTNLVGVVINTVRPAEQTAEQLAAAAGAILPKLHVPAPSFLPNRRASGSPTRLALPAVPEPSEDVSSALAGHGLDGEADKHVADGTAMEAVSHALLGGPAPASVMAPLDGAPAPADPLEGEDRAWIARMKARRDEEDRDEARPVHSMVTATAGSTASASASVPSAGPQAEGRPKEGRPKSNEGRRASLSPDMDRPRRASVVQKDGYKRVGAEGPGDAPASDFDEGYYERRAAMQAEAEEMRARNEYETVSPEEAARVTGTARRRASGLVVGSGGMEGTAAVLAASMLGGEAAPVWMAAGGTGTGLGSHPLSRRGSRSGEAAGGSAESGEDGGKRKSKRKGRGEEFEPSYNIQGPNQGMLDALSREMVRAARRRALMRLLGREPTESELINGAGLLAHIDSEAGRMGVGTASGDGQGFEFQANIRGAHGYGGGFESHYTGREAGAYDGDMTGLGGAARAMDGSNVPVSSGGVHTKYREQNHRRRSSVIGKLERSRRVQEYVDAGRAVPWKLLEAEDRAARIKDANDNEELAKKMYDTGHGITAGSSPLRSGGSPQRSGSPGVGFRPGTAPKPVPVAQDDGGVPFAPGTAPSPTARANDDGDEEEARGPAEGVLHLSERDTNHLKQRLKTEIRDGLFAGTVERLPGGVHRPDASTEAVGEDGEGQAVIVSGNTEDGPAALRLKALALGLDKTQTSGAGGHLDTVDKTTAKALTGAPDTPIATRRHGQGLTPAAATDADVEKNLSALTKDEADAVRVVGRATGANVRRLRALQKVADSHRSNKDISGEIADRELAEAHADKEQHILAMRAQFGSDETPEQTAARLAAEAEEAAKREEEEKKAQEAEMPAELLGLPKATALAPPVRADGLPVDIHPRSVGVVEYNTTGQGLAAYEDLVQGGILANLAAARAEQLRREGDIRDEVDKEKRQRAAAAANAGLGDMQRHPPAGPLAGLGTSYGLGPAATASATGLGTGTEDGLPRDPRVADGPETAEHKSPESSPPKAGPYSSTFSKDAVDLMFKRARAALDDARKGVGAAAATKHMVQLYGGTGGGPKPMGSGDEAKGKAEVEANALATGFDPRRDPAMVIRTDPYSQEYAVLAAPAAGVRKVQPAFGEGLYTGLWSGNPYAMPETVRQGKGGGSMAVTGGGSNTGGIGGANPGGALDALSSTPAPHEITGITLKPAQRGVDPPQAESVREKRMLQTKRLVDGARDVRLYRYLGGVQFTTLPPLEDQEEGYGSDGGAGVEGGASSLDRTSLESRGSVILARGYSAEERERGRPRRRSETTSIANHALAGGRTDAGAVAARHARPASAEQLRYTSLAGTTVLVDRHGRLAEEPPGLPTAVIRANNPFAPVGDPNDPALGAGAVRTREQLLSVLLDKGDHNRRPANDEKHAPATYMRGYTSGDVAEFLRLESTYAPYAEAEWYARAGAYLEGRASVADYVKAVRRRMQGRDPLTGQLIPLAAGPGGATMASTDAGMADEVDSRHGCWDPLLVPLVRKFFSHSYRTGLPPLYGTPTPEQAKARADLSDVVARYRRLKMNRVTKSLAEQWEEYEALYHIPPELVSGLKEEAKRKAEEQRIRGEAARKSKWNLMMGSLQSEVKARAERQHYVAKLKRQAAKEAAKAEFAPLAQQANEAAAAKYAEAHAKAEAMGLNADYALSKHARLNMQAAKLAGGTAMMTVLRP